MSHVWQLKAAALGQIALVGLLRRTLTDVEVHQIASALVGMAQQGEVITTADVERLVTGATLGDPAPSDVARVSARLAAGGWPLADAR